MASGCSGSGGAINDRENIPGPLGVKYDDREDSIDVILVVPGIKKPGLFGFGRNAVVDLTVKEQSLEVFVQIEKLKKKKNSNDKCLFSVTKLPAKVIPDDCSYHFRENQVVITLAKATSESWIRYLDTGGLETASED